MINHLLIKNFKSHSESSFDFSYLNILTGLNGTGKSSVFQSLFLLRQSFFKNILNDGLDLNKPLCSIGQASDAFYQFGIDDVITFDVQFSKKNRICWEFIYDKPESTFLVCKNKQKTENAKISILSLFNSNFQYLSARRMAPQEIYRKDTYNVEKNRQLSIENGKGELIAHFLHHYGKEKMLYNDLKHPDAFNDYLESHVDAWISEIARNIHVDIKDNISNFELRYQFKRHNQQPPTDEMKAENVGFGITYVLPIVTAILAAKQGSILFFENPESHLHPAGQSKLARLIALAAQQGIQIFIETHSDHMINGTLIAIKEFHEHRKGIDRDRVRVYYFDRDETEHRSIIHPIPISEKGRIINPPPGFFDQFNHDVKNLMGI